MGRLLLLVALAALAAVVYRLSTDDAALDDAAPRSMEKTGYYLRDALVTEYGPDGQPYITLAARTATEDPDTRVIALQEVEIDYLARTNQRWRVTADTGSAQPAMRTVDLAGNVVMTGQQQALPQPAVVRTARMTLDTEAELAYTDAPLTLGFGEYSIAATGMRADLKAETLRLESGVHGRFTP